MTSTYIVLRSKKSGGYVALHGADWYWYLGTRRQAFLFRSVEHAKSEYRSDLSDFVIEEA